MAQLPTDRSLLSLTPRMRMSAKTSSRGPGTPRSWQRDVQRKSTGGRKKLFELTRTRMIRTIHDMILLDGIVTTDNMSTHHFLSVVSGSVSLCFFLFFFRLWMAQLWRYLAFKNHRDTLLILINDTSCIYQCPPITPIYQSMST